MTGLILLLGLLLRLPLFNQSLWLDEAIEALALRGHYGSLWSYSLSDFQPPLYHYLLLPWTQLFGTSELALRIPSLLAGIGTIYYLIMIGRALWSQKVGIIVGLLATTNPLLIYYSQEGRTYALTTFLVTASMYYFIKIYRNSPNSLTSLCYLLTTTLYLWSSYLSWFLWLSLVLYLLISKRYRLFALHALPATTLLFWFPSLIRSLQIGLADAIAHPGWGSVVGGFSPKALALTWVKFALGRISFENNLVYAMIVSLVGFLHTLVLKQAKHSPIILLWLLAPLATTALISLWIPAYSYTRVLFVLPAYLLILATSNSKIMLSGLLVIQLTALGYYYITPRFHKEDWRTLVSDLNKDPSAQLIMPSLRQDPALRYYQLTLPKSDASNTSLSAPRVYYLNYVANAFDPQGVTLQSLANQGYTKTSERSYPGLAIEIYENRH